MSAPPPARSEDGEPTRWGAALAGCVGVSALVLVFAFALTRLAEAAEPEQELVEVSPMDGDCQSTAPLCLDPTLWARDAR